MADAGLQPDISTYKAMINAFVVGSTYNDGFDLHEALLQGEFGNLRPCEET